MSNQVKMSDVFKLLRNDEKSFEAMSTYTSGDLAFRNLLYKREDFLKDVILESCLDNKIRSQLTKLIFVEPELNIEAWENFHDSSNKMLFYASHLVDHDVNVLLEYTFDNGPDQTMEDDE